MSRTDELGSTPAEPKDTQTTKGDEFAARWQQTTGEEREATFRAIYFHFFPRIYQFFSRRGCIPQDAEDMSQETLLRVYNAMPQFRGEARIEVWIFTVANNVYLNAMRARLVEKRKGSEVSFETESNLQLSAEQSGTDPLDQAMHSEQRALISHAIATLPPQMRRCVALRTVHGLKYREIAEILRISVDTVKAHLHQARQRLQNQLRGHFEDVEF